MKNILTWFKRKPKKGFVMQNDLQILSNNSSEDLHILLIAVQRELIRCADDLSRRQTLHGWRIMIEGSITMAKDRESEAWVDRQMKEIFAL